MWYYLVVMSGRKTEEERSRRREVAEEFRLQHVGGQRTFTRADGELVERGKRWGKRVAGGLNLIQTAKVSSNFGRDLVAAGELPKVDDRLRVVLDASVVLHGVGRPSLRACEIMVEKVEDEELEMCVVPGIVREIMGLVDPPRELEGVAIDEVAKNRVVGLLAMAVRLYQGHRLPDIQVKADPSDNSYMKALEKARLKFGKGKVFLVSRDRHLLHLGVPEVLHPDEFLGEWEKGK